MSRYLFTAFLVICLSSCEEDFLEPTPEPRIVVEGWIENGAHPIVQLTRTMPIPMDDKEVEDLAEYMVRWAKVTVSDGEKSAILVGMYDKDYFPPYIYTTSEITGEVGKTYTLTVESAVGNATAVTTIPPPPHIDSIEVRRGELNDTLWSVYAYVSRQENEYFQFFVQDFKRDKIFKSSFLGAFSSDELPEQGSRRMAVNNSWRTFGSKEDYTTSFPADALLRIKLAAMHREGYDFWVAFEKMLSLSRNPLFPVDENLPSNIKNGYGYWIGYGTEERNVILKDN